jgi:hypothetical protein
MNTDRPDVQRGEVIPQFALPDNLPEAPDWRECGAPFDVPGWDVTWFGSQYLGLYGICAISKDPRPDRHVWAWSAMSKRQAHDAASDPASIMLGLLEGTVADRPHRNLNG